MRRTPVLHYFFSYTMDIRKDTSFLIKAEIIEISFGVYNMWLLFNNKITISTGTILEYRQSDGMVYTWTGIDGRAPFSMNRLLEIPVSSAFVEEVGTLHIHFDNGDEIAFVAVDEPCESFMLSSPDTFQVINHLNQEYK